MSLQDDELQRETQRIDPHDIFGWLSLAATMINIVYSIVVPYYTFDWLISTSLVLGILSIANRNKIIPKISIFLLFLHLSVVAVIRLLG